MSLEITEDLIAKQSPEAQAIIRLLLDRLAELEARLGKSPQNSSLPPSAQHPHAKPTRPQREGKKKKRGGQKGHQKHHRELIPPEQCNDVIPLRPDACRRCGKSLTGSDPEPIRHQVWELPEIKPIVTEYQQHCLACRCCGITTCALLPPGVPSGQSGQQPVLLTNGDTATQAIGDLDKVVFEGGGDDEEHHLSAMEVLANSVPWNADPQKARGALLAFTTADSKPAGSGKSARELGESLRSRGLLVYLICEATPQLNELCDGAGGLMFPISNDPDPKDLQKIAAQLSASIIQTIASGGTVPLEV